jgi:hypothetical protein
MASPAHRTGLFAVRAWIDPARPEGFTARVTWSLDVSRKDQVEMSSVTASALEAALRDWLSAFLAIEDPHQGKIGRFGPDDGPDGRRDDPTEGGSQGAQSGQDPISGT